MPDAVADRFGALRTYLSGHPDALVAYAKYFGKVTDAIESVEVLSIDSNRMTLAYKTKGEAGKKEVVVNFDPPLLGYEEVKPRLIAMKAEAKEALCMVEFPQVKSFNFPPEAWPSVALVGVLVILQFFSDVEYVKAIRTAMGGPFTIQVFGCIWFGIHFFEAFFTAYLCGRHQTGFILAVAYVSSNFLFGVPIIMQLRKEIQAARINRSHRGRFYWPSA